MEDLHLHQILLSNCITVALSSKTGGCVFKMFQTYWFLFLFYVLHVLTVVLIAEIDDIDVLEISN